MRFSIITPSYRNSDWLKLCIASVADQEGIELEHIVQDSCSDDGTQDWLVKDSRVKAYIEKDSGMYDAVNRGFRRSKGDLLAYLNCDEQYLPGALNSVQEFFVDHPEVDVAVSDTVVTDPEGEYICHRYSLVPRANQIWVRFPVLTCSLFVRRRVVENLGIYFDTQWRALGDLFWIMEMTKQNLKMAVFPRFTSVFTDTGENMSLQPIASKERRLKWQMAPAWVKLLQFPLIIQYRMRLAARGSLFQKPFEYDLYTRTNPQTRVIRKAAKPTSFWKSRLRG